VARAAAPERSTSAAFGASAREVIPLALIEGCPAYERVWQRRLRLLWRERKFSCVSREGLLIMKRVAGRPQDLADIEALEANRGEA
jgi:hypothetical protein